MLRNNTQCPSHERVGGIQQPIEVVRVVVEEE